MQSDLAEMPWIDDDLVLAVANTVVLHDPSAPEAGSIDLWAEESSLARWRSKIPDPDLARLPRGELLELRDDVRAVLDAVDRRAPVPDPVRERLNAAARSAPCTLELDPTGQVRVAELSDDGGARVARQTLGVLDEAADRQVRRCPAPGCGMFFRPGRRDQAWCTLRCGTRARAARLRQRSAPAGVPSARGGR